VENETYTSAVDGEGYFLMRDPTSPVSQASSAGYHNSEYFTPRSPSTTAVEHTQPKTILEESQNSQVSIHILTYEEICQKIIQNSVFLLLGVKSAVTFKQGSPTTSKTSNSAPKSSSLEDLINNDYDDDEQENLPTAKSSETFRSPESRYYGGNGGRIGLQKGALLVRRFGRNILRFVSNEIISSKREWYFDGLHSNEGWNSDQKSIYVALKRQEERAKLRIEALSQVSQLLAKSKRSLLESSQEKLDSENQNQGIDDAESDFLVSVHEFLIAGCYHLGLSNPPTILGKVTEVAEQDYKPSLKLCHYLDEVQSAPIALQNQIVDTVHEVIQWLITGLQSQAASLDGSFSSRKSDRFQSDEVKLLNLFSLSCRFKASDLRLAVNSGLLGILEKFAAGIIHLSPSSSIGKMSNEVLSNLPYSHFVTVASVRLLHMIAVSTS